MFLLKVSKVISGGSYSLSGRSISTGQFLQNKEKCKVLIIGGGSGGCAVASKLSRMGEKSIVVLEPNEQHYYQPMFTMIGGGMKKLEDSHKTMKSVLPRNIKHFVERAVKFNPKDNSVTTNKGRQIEYEVLLIAMGLQLNYDKIPGLIDALSMKNNKVSSIYSPKYVNQVYDNFRRFEKGNAIFTFPNSPVKCPGAPQKIMYIFEHFLRKNNKRENAKIIYNTSLPVIFGVKHYADALWKIVKERNIEVNVRRNLIEVKPKEDIAVFQNLDDPNEKIEIQYSLLHVVPPMSTPTELINAKEIVNENGFVDVNQSTMQHNKFKSIFAIGDCSGTPNSKTAASAAAQTPVVVNHILATLKGKELKSKYNGYASCPLVTGYNSCILAEFDYNLKPLETFPLAQNKERYSMFIMKKYFMPFLYWNFMLKGWWNGPEPIRKMFSVIKSEIK